MIRHKAPIGPFGMMDLFGLNLIYDSWRYREDDAANRDLRRKILALLEPLVAKGELGMKSGRGFYHYPQPHYQQGDFLEGQADLDQSYNALLTALIGNAVLVASLAVAEPADIDRAWMVGTYLDIGPFGILDKLGIPEFLLLLETQVTAGRFDSDRAQQVTDFLSKYSSSDERKQ
jgi:3-hydroxybutyryl-CoA dehydrogenase